MKPIILIEKENGKIHLTREELQELLDNAYNEGYKDSSRYFKVYPTWTWTNSDSYYTTTGSTPHVSCVMTEVKTDG